MTWSPDDGHGAPPPVETAGQQLEPMPQEATVELGAPQILTPEQMAKALENARRVRKMKVEALAVALQHESRPDAIRTDMGEPYFSEWFLHDLWAMTGGGRLSCIQPPKRHQLEGGHYYFEAVWRAEHRYFGSVDGNGIASSGDKFLGTNEGGKHQKRQLEAVNPHLIANHASTRAKRNAMEELLGTQGWTWELLKRLRAGESVDLRELEAGARELPQESQPSAFGGGQQAAAPSAYDGAHAAQPEPPPQQPAAQPEGGYTPEELKLAERPRGTKEPGPGVPMGQDGNRVAPGAYLGQLVKSQRVTPEELLAHARLRHGFNGSGLRDAPVDLQGNVAWACAQDLGWVKLAAQYVVESVEDDIPF